ncbi:Holliday junction branch migration DNA helicase RuvB [Sandaracinus amylolyticus]|uniref:Holliday junction branch migration DNA helicase RuvB n=1 Tax=Sandaracinus amylolyticus TaxID=927083 RepID=UPI001F2A9BB8|nr:Holliday junction branch migration DNA helicase RuvB [Sandaracinus amylolyticus]UJR78401.1 Holliday junction branch migration DNA helicase RuvB [Sandaracinus amylolyticus]
MATKKKSPKASASEIERPQNLLEAAPAGDEESRLDASLRPTRFEEFVGQPKLVENLRVYVHAARARGGPLDHTLFFGPPGLGKTTLANILAAELGVTLHLAHGPAIEHKGQLAALLTKLGERDVLFIDEIHRLSSVVEENLYTAMEDFRIDVVHGDGPMANTLQIPIAPFTLVGATTRTGLLTGPLLSRFGIEARLDYYDPSDLARIVRRSAGILEVRIDDEACLEIARRARGTPRIANRLLRRSRDFAEVLGDGKLDAKTARAALERLEVDELGLDEMNRRFLRAIIEFYGGGPVGIEALAATLSEPRDTLEDVIEPYLLQNGFLARTARGRMATERAFEHLGLKAKKKQGTLF